MKYFENFDPNRAGWEIVLIWLIPWIRTFWENWSILYCINIPFGQWVNFLELESGGRVYYCCDRLSPLEVYQTGCPKNKWQVSWFDICSSKCEENSSVTEKIQDNRHAYYNYVPGRSLNLWLLTYDSHNFAPGMGKKPENIEYGIILALGARKSLNDKVARSQL